MDILQARRSPHSQAEGGDAREDLTPRLARSRAINGPGNSGVSALLRLLGERPARCVPHCDPFAKSVVLDLNANDNKASRPIEPIGVAYPRFRHYVRSSFGLLTIFSNNSTKYWRFDFRFTRRIPTALRGEYLMNSSSNADFSTTLNRILDTAADNLRIAKISGSNGSRSQQHHLRCPTQPAARNCAGQHHACQYVRCDWCHLSCSYFADAYNGAAAHREHGRLYILRRLWRALRGGLGLLSCICFSCRSMQFASAKCSN